MDGPRDSGSTGSAETTSGSEDTGVDSPSVCVPGDPRLPTLHAADVGRADAGFVLLTQELGQGQIPRLALDNLWIAWGATPYADTDVYWQDFRKRYGLVEAPWDNDQLPLGLHAVGGDAVTVDCLFCHSDRVAGQTLVGAGNSAVDFQGFFDDLETMNELAPNYGFPSVPLPWVVEGRTPAAGATDAYGLGLELSVAYGPSSGQEQLDTIYGATQPAAWWNLPYKERSYSDGSGRAAGHRTMAAMTLAFGWSWEELMANDSAMEDLGHYMRSLQAPSWPFEWPAGASVEQGATLFEANCAACHGSYCGESASFPDATIPVQAVGTDPERERPFDDAEVQWINGSWFGNPPVEDTDAYLAPALVGVWASAPYFHNGSVPTLAGVLNPAARPPRWRRSGGEIEDYDPVAVGLKYDAVETSPGQETIEDRKVYDTQNWGLSNSGHDFGSSLSEAERAALLDYLKTL